MNGGYSFKTNFTGPITIQAAVTITGACIGGTLASDTITVDLGTTVVLGCEWSDWKPTGDQNSVAELAGGHHGAGNSLRR